MKITIIQQDIAWKSPKANVERADALIDTCPGGDLYVLPEMFTTGFCTEPQDIAEPHGGETLQWMLRKARETDAAIAGSVVVSEDGKYYNRFYFAMPDGTVCHADKKHLFTYGGEDKCFTPGNERVIVEWRGMRILLLVCYDLRFPIWSRNRKDYDLILYVASWPCARMEVWSTLLRARAMENQCYVAGVNRVGKDIYGEYTGGSIIVDPYGKPLADCGTEEGGATAEPNMKRLENFRKKFPVLDDADIWIFDK